MMLITALCSRKECVASYSTRYGKRKGVKDPSSSCFLLLLVLLTSGLGQGQSLPSDFFKLPANTDVRKMPWWNNIYQFEDFQEGQITFITGFTAPEKFRFNHNLYFGGIDLINKQGDTVQLKPSREIKFIHVGEHVFLHDIQKGYVELLVQLPVSLGSVTMINLEYMEYASGRYGSGNTKGDLPRTEIRGQTESYDRYYKKRTSYFFIDRKNKMHKAVKPYLYQLFPRHKEKINLYVLDNDIDFTYEEDLLKLIKFCNALNQVPPPDPGNSFIVKAGQRLVDVAGKRELARFDEFQPGTISYTDGTTADESKMNYNLFTGEMEIIGSQGDTVKTRRNPKIKNINVDGTSFLHDSGEGYIEILAHAPVSLGVHSIISVLVSETLSGEHVESITTDTYYKGRTPRAVANEDKLFIKVNRYFFIDQRNRPYPATRYALLKLYPDHKDDILAYVREHKINFEKEEDLKKVQSYCTQLPQ